LERRQADGAFSFDTDGYVLEAKWWKKPMSRGSLDVFAAEVRRKGENALRLCVAINGFTKRARRVRSFHRIQARQAGLHF